ncbi:NAD kinase [Georgenia faecalis]|uniref:NAD kinase n=1 Tax=Georgenia faecalis TaxID=2483799 RepID=A0ABV9DDY9_9MICO|nr:NAD kinase [Georgenia faecalis]
MTRRVLVVMHEGRPAAVEAAAQVERELRERGMTPVRDTGDTDGLELVIVLGGDGTILRAAELARGSDVPLVGVNLGHVGFLAEAEPDGIREVVRRVAERDYTVEERMTIDVAVTHPGGEVVHGWAINEASVEKSGRARMVEVALGVDGRGVSTFGCDSVVLATPTGSTAYAFSGGGPIVWPDVEALLVVPVAAHALFARPMVVGPSSVLAVEVLPRSERAAVVWCDGRRRLPAPAGSHIEVRRGAQPVKLARLEPTPFSGRLVAKFDLPVTGWRGERGAS